MGDHRLAHCLLQRQSTRGFTLKGFLARKRFSSKVKARGAGGHPYLLLTPTEASESPPAGSGAQTLIAFLQRFLKQVSGPPRNARPGLTVSVSIAQRSYGLPTS